MLLKFSILKIFVEGVEHVQANYLNRVNALVVFSNGKKRNEFCRFVYFFSP
jgi:hypothetical protein